VIWNTVLGRILKLCTRVSGQGLGTARVGAEHVGKPVAPVSSRPRSSGSTLGSIFRSCGSVNERSKGACTPVGLAVLTGPPGSRLAGRVADDSVILGQDAH